MKKQIIFTILLILFIVSGSIYTLYNYFLNEKLLTVERKDDMGSTGSKVDKRYEELEKKLESNITGSNLINNTGKDIVLDTNNFVPPIIEDNVIQSNFKVYIQDTLCNNVKNKYFCFINNKTMTDAIISVANVDSTFNYYISSPTNDSELIENFTGGNISNLIKSVKIKNISDITNVTINIKKGSEILEQKIVEINKTLDPILIDSITLVHENFKLSKNIDDVLDNIDKELKLRTLPGKNYIYIKPISSDVNISCKVDNKDLPIENKYCIVNLENVNDVKDVFIYAKSSSYNIENKLKLVLIPFYMVVLGENDNLLNSAILNSPYQGVINTYRLNKDPVKYEILSTLPANMITEQQGDSLVLKADKIDMPINFKLNVHTSGTENNMVGSGLIEFNIPLYQNIVITTEMLKSLSNINSNNNDLFPKGTEIVLKKVKDGIIVGKYGKDVNDCTKGLCRILLTNDSSSVMFEKFPIINDNSSIELEIYIPGVGSKNFVYNQGTLQLK